MKLTNYTKLFVGALRPSTLVMISALMLGCGGGSSNNNDHYNDGNESASSSSMDASGNNGGDTNSGTNTDTGSDTNTGGNTGTGGNTATDGTTDTGGNTNTGTGSNTGSNTNTGGTDTGNNDTGNNAGNYTGGNTNTGGSTGSNTGGSTGSNTGTGTNTGTGGSTGSNTNTGGGTNAGGNTNTGGTTTGGNTGSNTNTGGSTDSNTNTDGTTGGNDGNNNAGNYTGGDSGIVQTIEQCQYWGRIIPLCQNQSTNWSSENGADCIGRQVCESDGANNPNIGIISTPVDGEGNTGSSSSSDGGTTGSGSNSSTGNEGTGSGNTGGSNSSAPNNGPLAGHFKVDESGNIVRDGEILPIRCGSWFGLEGQHEPKHAANNADGAPLELYVGNMWWADGGRGTGRTIQQTMDEITALGINTVRFPIAPQTLDAKDPQGIGAAQNGGVLKNHSSVMQTNARQAMEDFIKLADKNDINLIIDIHSCSNYVGWRAGRLDAKPPYADADRINYDYTREGYSCSATDNPSTVKPENIHAYNEAKWLADLKEIASLREKLGVDNIMAIDIFNEPWDYTWAEWKDLAEKAYTTIAAENDDILVMVEGIAGGTGDGTEVPHGDEATNPNWGENFYPAKADPLNIPKNRLIISPHTYGPSVFVQKQFIDPNQSECEGLEGDDAAEEKCNIVINSTLLKEGWEEHFGFLRDEGYAMIVGEFGGAMDWPRKADNGVNWLHVTENVDQQWQNAFVDYMIEEDIQGCYWSINPESADTGGLYKHAYVKGSNEGGWGTWEDFDTRKVNLLKRFWGM